MTILESELSNLFTRKTTTLNFEGNSIRCLTLKGDQIRSWEKISFPREKMSQGLVHDPAAVSKGLDKLLNKVEASRRNVITSITDQRTVHRILTLPAIDEKLLDETVQRKAKQEFALPIDEVDISWKIVRRQENKLGIYVLAVPKQIIDRQMDTLQNIQIKPQKMDAKPLALAQAVNRSNALIINLESYSMAVIILVDGIPVIVRTVPLESGDLTREAKLDLLHQEFARTTKFYNESNKRNRLPEDTPVFPTGALFDPLPVQERLEDSAPLVDRLKEKSSYSVKGYSPPIPIPPKIPLMEYAVNIGLAYKALQ